MDIRKFFIKPAIPKQLDFLQELAFNMWSCWDKSAWKIFHRLDPLLFREVNHNPVELLYRLKPERLEEVAKDKGFLFELEQVQNHFLQYRQYEGTYSINGVEKPLPKENVVAYICMEYGLHESLPVYSGGLAVLAGDMLKAASDVGIPMVSFGLLYQYGYFNQHLTSEGMQIEEYKENNWFLCPVKEVVDSHGAPLFFEVPLKNKKIVVKLWQVDVGNVKLYLFDANIRQNPPEIRLITSKLYDADRPIRLEQELLLGRGTEIALRALGIQPSIYHLNEGHTAFVILERLLDLVKGKGYSLDEARIIIKNSTVFTTHTPVAEGNENFPEAMIAEYLKDEVKLLGLTMEDFLSLGRVQKKEKTFWLPAFAIRYSSFSNGVSKIHGAVSRAMWRDLFPTLHEKQYPIDSITNGIHLQSWLSLQMTELFDRYIGPDYLHKGDEAALWEKVYKIPDSEIWNAHRRRKEQVMYFIRRRLSQMMVRRGYCKNKIKDIETVLNPDYLTIGFARRFAPYKRASLLFNDPERLLKIITNKKKPVQFVFSGKAHPADNAGKELIKQVISFINNYPVENHVVFLEDYDINVARHLAQGVDVWLNTPLKPMEASGTSGMKAGINGILNLSVLDGWWPEAYNGKNGWAIDSNANYPLTFDEEAEQIYEIIEREIADLYYDRREKNLPVEWVKMMKNAIATICCNFNMQRNVREYLYKCYLPEIEISKKLEENERDLVRKLRMEHAKIESIWSKIYIRDYFTSIDGKLPVSGENVSVDCYVYLDDIDESLIKVELFYSQNVDSSTFKTIPLNFVERYQDKVAKYTGSLTLEDTGQQELSVCLVPADPDFRMAYPEYVKWKE